MTLAQALALTSIVGAPLTAIMVLVSVRNYLREARNERERREADRLRAAVDPIKEDLATMTAERNYWRDRSGNLESRLYGREK